MDVLLTPATPSPINDFLHLLSFLPRACLGGESTIGSYFGGLFDGLVPGELGVTSVSPPSDVAVVAVMPDTALGGSVREAPDRGMTMGSRGGREGRSWKSSSASLSTSSISSAGSSASGSGAGMGAAVEASVKEALFRFIGLFLGSAPSVGAVEKFSWLEADILSSLSAVAGTGSPTSRVESGSAVCLVAGEEEEVAFWADLFDLALILDGERMCDLVGTEAEIAPC